MITPTEVDQAKVERLLASRCSLDQSLIAIAFVVATANVLLFSPAMASSASPNDCASLAKLKLPETIISVIEMRPAGSFAMPGAAQAQALSDLPAFCRVAGTIKPQINFEVWLPAADWNGKLLTTAAGGFAGSIGYRALAEGLDSHYATTATDQGHVLDANKQGSSAADWAVGHPERIESYAYRGIHETTLQAKAIIQAYYGDAPAHAYIKGCSGGGRTALVEASRFPADYDGIIAGAPSYNSIHVWSRLMQAGKALFKDEASRVLPAQLPPIRDAILKACDADDGVVDGLLEDPRKCDFDLTTLQCAGAQATGCFTAPQIAALKAVYGPLQDTDGRVLTPGPPAGIDLSGNLQQPMFGGPEPWATGVGFFKHWVYAQPDWDFRSYDPVLSTQLAEQKFAALLHATPDLRAFAQRGGKLILYQGWADEGIPAGNTINYYRDVIRVATGKEAPDDVAVDAADFVRLYMVPGMSHCSGGYGPNVFNMLPALERWVEHRKPPDTIIASRLSAGSGTVERTRPLCPFPQMAAYNGTGSTDEARNFRCKSPRVDRGASP